jgi:hypothetical protein
MQRTFQAKEAVCRRPPRASLGVFRRISARASPKLPAQARNRRACARFARCSGVSRLLQRAARGHRVQNHCTKPGRRLAATKLAVLEKRAAPISDDKR